MRVWMETIKRTVQPYFVLEGNICALLAAKDHVNVFRYDGGMVPDPAGIITAGHHNQTARAVGFRQGEVINASALSAMFTQIIANNRAGGWRRLKTLGLITSPDGGIANRQSRSAPGGRRLSGVGPGRASRMTPGARSSVDQSS